MVSMVIGIATTLAPVSRPEGRKGHCLPSAIFKRCSSSLDEEGAMAATMLML